MMIMSKVNSNQVNKSKENSNLYLKQQKGTIGNMLKTGANQV